jgi:uncharacterized protein (TIGR01777 family)
VAWDPAWAGGLLDLSRAGRIDAVVHLAGAGIADARWTDSRRREIRDSRVRGTRLLAEALARLDQPPRVVVGGSATGFYGATGETVVDESAPPGAGFLAGVTQAWEEAWAPLAGRGTRLVFLRTGVVLSPAGGALAKLLPAFRLGLGGPVGDGRQWWSWISIDDLAGVIGHALRVEAVRGALNAVAPEPVRSGDFAAALGAVLRRPAFLPAPGVGETHLAEAAQLASLADETPEGRSVVVLAKERFQIRERDAADEDMRQRCAAAADRWGAPAAALLFACAGRGQGLFGVPNHDAGLMADAFGPVPLAGFFCSGEFGPVAGRNFLHGYTASAALIYAEV